MFIKSFSRLQHSSKDGALKISAFCSYKKKKRVIRGKDEGYRLPKQKSKNVALLQNTSVLERLASQIS